MDIHGKYFQGFDWKFDRKNVLTPEEFFKHLHDLFLEKEVISIGEYHETGEDSSYAEILNHTDEILQAYRRYKSAERKSSSGSDLPGLERLLPRYSMLLETLEKENAGFDHLRSMHVSRLFALTVMPIAKASGFSDIILEGIDEEDPEWTISRSKDQVGDLLQLVSAMMLGMRIHGAYAEGHHVTSADIADALFAKLQNVKEAYPDSKILIYNGAMHSMTEPFGDEVRIQEGEKEYPAKDITYAPRAIELFKEHYGVIDLLNKDRKLPESHYSYMQAIAEKDAITCFTHGVHQETFIID